MNICQCSAPGNRGAAKDKWNEYAGVIDNTSIHKLQQAMNRDNGTLNTLTVLSMSRASKQRMKVRESNWPTRADHARACPPDVFESIGCTNAATEAVIGYRLPFSYNSVFAVLEEVIQLLIASAWWALSGRMISCVA